MQVLLTTGSHRLKDAAGEYLVHGNAGVERSGRSRRRLEREVIYSTHCCRESAVLILSYETATI